MPITFQIHRFLRGRAKRICHQTQLSAVLVAHKGCLQVTGSHLQNIFFVFFFKSIIYCFLHFQAEHIVRHVAQYLGKDVIEIGNFLHLRKNHNHFRFVFRFS